jgi:hypothetical protein
VVEGSPALGGAIDGFDVVDGHADEVVAGRSEVTFEQGT